MMQQCECRLITGKIYRLVSDETNLVYIGSTILPLKRRLYNHKYIYNKDIQTSSQYLCMYPDVRIELIEEFQFYDRRELNKREGYYIRTTPHVVNRNIAGRDNKQYRIDHRDQYKQYAKEYYKRNIEYYKRYRDENKEYIDERAAVYRKKHAAAINENAKEVVICLCGTPSTKSHIARHQKTAICSYRMFGSINDIVCDE